MASPAPSLSITDKLPNELILMILPWVVDMSMAEKNAVTPLRLVCKAFDTALQPFLFKTIVLEFRKFLRKGGSEISALNGVGKYCHAVYLDMMVIRDEEEVTRLSEVFRGITTKLPQMGIMIQALRNNCLGQDTFDETDFNQVVDRTFELTPKMTRLKINLPFHVLGRSGSTATLLLTNILASVAKRPEEYKPVEYLVIDHLSDSTILDLCRNPQDLLNAVDVLKSVKHLIISIKRQETSIIRSTSFCQHIWYLVRKATALKSLCIIGWNGKRDIKSRKHHVFIDMEEWRIRSLPDYNNNMNQFQHIKCLELKRVDIEPGTLINLITDISPTLKELYLNEVYLKVNSARHTTTIPLWIGHPFANPNTIVIAQSLRKINLHLDILRVSALGYDDFELDPADLYPEYDLVDPSGEEISFDQRFVDAVMSPEPPTPMETPETTDLPTTAPDSPSEPITQPLPRPREPPTYDVEAFQHLHHNSTSYFKKCIDGHFINHNGHALQELQNIITVADHGMALIAMEMDRTRSAPWTNQ